MSSFSFLSAPTLLNRRKKHEALHLAGPRFAREANITLETSSVRRIYDLLDLLWLEILVKTLFQVLLPLFPSQSSSRSTAVDRSRLRPRPKGAPNTLLGVLLARPARR